MLRKVRARAQTHIYSYNLPTTPYCYLPILVFPILNETIHWSKPQWENIASIIFFLILVKM